MLLVIGLSSLAAFLFAAAASLQQHEARQANRTIEAEQRPDEPRAFLLALAYHLPRSHLWRLGWLVNLAGFAAQGAALYFGSVPLVQVVLVTQLIFALPLATAWTREWPRRLDWLSGAAICAGVIVFVATHGGPALDRDADRSRLLMTMLGVAVLVVALVRVAVHRSALMSAALLAVAAGLCFATSAALMKLTADDLVLRGVSATARDWPGYTLAITAFTAVVLGQWAFATGSLPTAVAATTITNPVASYLIAILAFHFSPTATAPRLAGIVAAAALICVGVVGLAHSAIVRGPSPSDSVSG